MDLVTVVGALEKVAANSTYHFDYEAIGTCGIAGLDGGLGS